MEETFAGLVAEVEKVVRPLGFRIERADFDEKTPILFAGLEQKPDDSSEVKITIVRKGKVG